MQRITVTSLVKTITKRTNIVNATSSSSSSSIIVQKRNLFGLFKKKEPVTPTPTEPGTYLFGFGANEKGQLGLNLDKRRIVERPSVITSKALKNHKLKMVASGTSHSLACTEDGLVYAWGHNKDGQLGLGDDNGAYGPVRVRDLPQNIVYVTCGDKCSGAITDDGKVYTWGTSKDFQGGIGGLGYLSIRGREFYPRLVEALNGVNVQQLSMGYTHSACITADGELYTWGKGAWGRLGHGDVSNQTQPKKLESLTEKVRVASCTKNTSGIVTESGKIYVFGKNDTFLLGADTSGALFGGGNFDASTTPMLLSPSNDPDDKFVFISLGENMAAAITEKGDIWNWGKNVNPIRKLKDVQNAISCDIAKSHQGYVTSDGMLYTMGENWSYQLGTESGTFNTSDAHKLNGEFLPGKVKQVACGHGFTLCISEIA